MSAYSGALEAVERVVNRGGEPAEVRRAVAAILRERLGREARVSDTVEVEGDLDDAGRALVERVTLLVSPYRS